FEDLYRGIRADKLTEINGSLFVSGSNFLRCYKGIELKSSGSFAVTGNDFLVKEPGACVLLSNGATGAEISGMTTGFDFSGNNFYYDGQGFPDEILVGLLYLCNTNQNFNTDFLVTGGSVRQLHGESDPFSQFIHPAGNTFSGDPATSLYCTIVNNGLEIDYHFYNGDPAQDPGIPDTTSNQCDITGFKREPVSQPNGNCAEPDSTCFPCPETHLTEWKTRFLENRLQWQTQKAAFPYITDEWQRTAAADTIRHLRIGMNRDGSRILMQYSLDTLGINVDSITRWLAMSETYSTDLRLARHHFFTGDYAVFDSLWSLISPKYEMDENEADEFERLGEVYDTLRARLSAGARLEKMPQSTLETLKSWALNCDESGFLSELILWRNGVEQSPDCSGSGSRPVITISDAAIKEKEQFLKVYPNPANGTLNVEYPGLVGQGTLRLCNLQGRTLSEGVLPEHSSRVSVPVNHLAPGIYLVELQHGQGLPFHGKVIIIR
ncbi:MAG: T9SS type A sorting domain-containing protein, partial [Thermoanaerobaculia bacterium]|nr:T9SS type A sorting domain-containing protein [Thermoanaerobaculia bacterium]